MTVILSIRLLELHIDALFDLVDLAFQRTEFSPEVASDAL